MIMTIEHKTENRGKKYTNGLINLNSYIEKAKILIEALPYIKNFSGKIFVIKYGGSAMKNKSIKAAVMQDIALLKLVGIYPVIVHGGGNEISEVMEKMGIKPKFINGLRITNKETMEVVEMVLSGKVNKEIVNEIQKHDIKAIGISGKDGNTIIAEKKVMESYDLGYVGEIVKVNSEILWNLIENDIIPVLSPVGKDEAGETTFNINADNVAAAVAIALKAEKLVYMTDVEGVLGDLNDNASLISSIALSEVPSYIENGTISGGMIPKVECCVYAVKNGVKSVHILDGRIEHSLLLEIFTEKGIGTMFEEY